MEEADVGRRSSDRTERAAFDRLSLEDEAIIVAFRKHTLLPLRPTTCHASAINASRFMTVIMLGVAYCSRNAKNQSVRELQWKRSASGKYNGR